MLDPKVSAYMFKKCRNMGRLLKRALPFWLGRKDLNSDSEHDDQMLNHQHQHQHQHATIMRLGPPAEVDTSSICFWLMILVGFTVFIEWGLHLLHHRLGERTSPGNQMIHKVKEELMLMGLLSFCVTMVDEVIDIDHKNKLSFEWAHTLLFISALVLVLLAVALIAIANSVYHRMHAMENADTRLLVTLAKQGSFANKHYRISHTEVNLHRAAQFQATRHAFLSEHQLPIVGFDFPEYLHRNLNYMVLEILEVSPKSWGIVAFISMLNFSRSFWLTESFPYFFALHTGGQELAAFAAVGWLLLGAQRIQLLKARRAYQILISNAIGESENANRRSSSIIGPDGSLTKALQMLQVDIDGIALSDDDGDDDRNTIKSDDSNEGSEKKNQKRSPLMKPVCDGISAGNRATRTSAKWLVTGVWCDQSSSSPKVHHAADAFVERISTLLFIGCLYTAMFLMRYARMILDLFLDRDHQHGHTDDKSVSAVGATFLGVAAILPLLLASLTLHELVDRTSFVLALTNVHKGSESYNEIDSVLDLTYTRGVEVREFRTTFLRAFKKRLKHRGDLYSIFQEFTEGALRARRETNESLSSSNHFSTDLEKRGSQKENERQMHWGKGNMGARNNEIGSHIKGMFTLEIRLVLKRAMTTFHKMENLLIRLSTGPPSEDMEKEGLQVLLETIYPYRLPPERHERLWKHLNTDLQGGVSYDEFEYFMRDIPIQKRGRADCCGRNDALLRIDKATPNESASEHKAAVHQRREERRSAFFFWKHEKID